MPAGRPLKFPDVHALAARITEYFDYCEKEILPYTVSGLALWLDCDNETIRNYRDRDEFSSTIKKAYQRCQAYAEKELYLNRHPAGPIFALKNFGWSDRSQTDITTGGQPINVIIPREIADKHDPDAQPSPDSPGSSPL